jgi:hypothetical protein
MAKTIQIRTCPTEVRRALTARAARVGMSLSAFLLRKVTKEVIEVVGRLSLEEALERARKREPVRFDEDPAVTIRKLRRPMP